MALARLRLPENVAGDFFVDSSCIDCDLCRQIAPHAFSRAGEQSVVFHQPETADEQMDTLKALITCPTASIGTTVDHPLQDAIDSYPEAIDDEVYFCGFASESSYGASSYLVVRPSGNLLIDSPRFTKPLADRISALGGIQTILLTHRDDVADHRKWAQHFKALRMMHRDDAGRLNSEIESIVSSQHSIQVDKDLLVIPTPGHTRGHMAFLYRSKFLFSGDHVWWSDTRQSLYASHNVCWYSWPEQIKSMEKLLEYSFEWILPGHGRRIFLQKEEMHRAILACLLRMRVQDRSD